MRGDERLELRHERAVAAECEIGLDPLLKQREPELLEPRRLDCRERLERELGERRPMPERERGVQPRGRGLEVACGPRVQTFGTKQLGAAEIEILRGNLEHVAARACVDRHVRREGLPELRDVHLHGLRRRLRRLRPETVHEPLGRHDLAGAKQELGQDGALLRPAERERRLPSSSLERPENPKLHKLLLELTLPRSSRGSRSAFAARLLRLCPPPVLWSTRPHGAVTSEGSRKMNLKGIQTHQLLAALGACLAAMLVAGPAAARPFDDGGASNQSAVEEQSSQTTPWYLTDQYRSFMLPAAEANRIVNQRQLELAADRSAQRAEQAATADEQIQVIPYLSHGILEPEQAWEVIPYLSHGVLTESDAASLAATSTTPDGYQPQLGGSTNELVGAPSRADKPDGYQPQLGVSDFSVVADDGFDWKTTGFAASILAALLVALTITFTRGNRHGYRSA